MQLRVIFPLGLDRTLIERLAEMGIDEVSLGGLLDPDPEKAIALMGKHVIRPFRG